MHTLHLHDEVEEFCCASFELLLHVSTIGGFTEPLRASCESISGFPITVRAGRIASLVFSVKAVLFDFDGTLWDPESSIFEVYAEELRQGGYILDSSLWKTVIGASESDLWAGLEHAFGKMDRQVLRARIHARKEKVLSTVTTRPGILPLLAAIDSVGIPRGIVSNSSDDWVGYYSKQCGIAHGWRTVECANGDPSRAKPNPDLYSEAVRRIGADPRAVIAFEDSPRGYSSGQTGRGSLHRRSKRDDRRSRP